MKNLFHFHSNILINITMIHKVFHSIYGVSIMNNNNNNNNNNNKLLNNKSIYIYFFTEK